MGEPTWGVREVMGIKGGGERDTGLNRFDTKRGAYSFLNDCVDGRDLPSDVAVCRLSLVRVDGDEETEVASFIKTQRGYARAESPERAQPGDAA